MTMKRGQGSAEYLILLAVVLIVALVAIMLMGGFTQFGGDAMSSQSLSYWNGPAKPFGIVEWAQIGTTLTMKVKNQESKRLVLNGVLIDGVQTGLNWTFKGGASKTVTITGLTACNATTNDFFSYAVAFNYSTNNINYIVQRGSKQLEGSCIE